MNTSRGDQQAASQSDFEAGKPGRIAGGGWPNPTLAVFSGIQNLLQLGHQDFQSRTDCKSSTVMKARGPNHCLIWSRSRIFRNFLRREKASQRSLKYNKAWWNLRLSQDLYHIFRIQQLGDISERRSKDSINSILVPACCSFHNP